MSLSGARSYIDRHIRIVLTGVIVVLLAFSTFGPIVQVSVPSEAYLTIILVFLVAIVDQLVTLKPSSSATSIFATQPEALNTIKSFIEKNRDIKTVDILAVSVSSLVDVLGLLSGLNCRIRVLMLDPRMTNDPAERNLIMSTYDAQTRYWAEAGKTGNIALAFYDVYAFMRGFKIDDSILALGWYTYLKGTSGGNPIIRLMGFKNPLLVSRSGSSQSKILMEFFKREFERLWNARLDTADVTKWWNTVAIVAERKP